LKYFLHFSQFLEKLFGNSKTNHPKIQIWTYLLSYISGDDFSTYSGENTVYIDKRKHTYQNQYSRLSVIWPFDNRRPVIWQYFILKCCHINIIWNRDGRKTSMFMFEMFEFFFFFCIILLCSIQKSLYSIHYTVKIRDSNLMH
jgi:hypothetical protein